jgi:hypothetical protein
MYFFLLYPPLNLDPIFLLLEDPLLGDELKFFFYPFSYDTVLLFDLWEAIKFSNDLFNFCFYVYVPLNIN